MTAVEFLIARLVDRQKEIGARARRAGKAADLQATIAIYDAVVALTVVTWERRGLEVVEIRRPRDDHSRMAIEALASAYSTHRDYPRKGKWPAA